MSGYELYTGQPLKLQAVRDCIRRFSPEQVDLSNQVINAVQFPHRLEALRRRDAARAHYVATMGTVLDIQRDARALSSRLESPDPAVRLAAEHRLGELGSPGISRPATDSPEALYRWSVQWQKWADQMRRAGPVRFWPPIPDSNEMPQDPASADLLEALDRSDENAFAKALRSWVDSGILRDGSIAEARSRRQQWPDADVWNCCASALTGSSYSPRDRFYSIALFVSNRDSAWFADEKERAKPFLAGADPCSQEVRRAAFWEPPPDGHSILKSVAHDRLLACLDEAASKELLKLYLEPNRPGIDTGLAGRYQHGDTLVEKALFESAGAGCDEHSAWVSRTLALVRDSRVIPLLVKCLKDPDPKGRRLAGWNLEITHADTVDALVDAIRAETDDGAREFELAALGEIDSPKALDILLAEADHPDGDKPSISVVRGLARIRDPRALKSLATIALLAKNGSQLLWESVSAFGFISGLYKGFAPGLVPSGGAMHPDIISEALPIMREWLKTHAQ